MGSISLQTLAGALAILVLTTGCGSGFQALSKMSQNRSIVSVPSDSTCLVNGTSVERGAFNVPGGYQASTVSYGSRCQADSYQGVCSEEGVTYSHTPVATSCSVASAATCTVNGTSVGQGNFNVPGGYQASTVSYGSSCQADSYQGVCSNGNVSYTHTPAATSCSVSSAANCTVNGTSVGQGNFNVPGGYQASTVSYGNSCQADSYQGVCSNGNVSYTHTPAAASCSVATPANCTVNGTSVGQGSFSVPGGYQASTVSYGSSCQADSYQGVCSNGGVTYSHTPAAGSCSVAAGTPFTVSVAQSIDVNNVYSPDLIMQGGTLVMYFGGWYVPGQTHDNIYRAECPIIGPCQPAALLIDSVARGFEHLNDPALVEMPGGYYIMYMTGVPAGENGLNLSSNHVYYSTSWDGIMWSTPAIVAQDIWLPTATLDPNGNVLLYGNSTANGEMVQYNLSPSGVNIVSRTVVNTPKFLLNVDVTYRPSLGLYEILAEESGQPNQIDYLVSYDGINWIMGTAGVVKPQPGSLVVRTPAPHPLTDAIVYYGQTSDPQSMGNSIWGLQWGVH